MPPPKTTLRFERNISRMNELDPRNPFARVPKSKVRQVRSNFKPYKPPPVARWLWHSTRVIAPTISFKKSRFKDVLTLRSGCSHGCRFCYVYSAATIEPGPALPVVSVIDADAEWGGAYYASPVGMKEVSHASLRPRETTPARWVRLARW